MYTKNNSLTKNRKEIREAISMIVDPVANTMSPRGGNVAFRNNEGRVIMTNDGATISKQIQPRNELQRMIVDAIIESSEQTNKIAGDATSTTILLNGAILNLFIDLNEKDGTTHFQFIRELRLVRDKIMEGLEKIKAGGEGLESNEEEITRVAYISANNDKEISDISVDVLKKAGDYGIIKYDTESNETNVKFDEGFVIYGAIPSPIFLNVPPLIRYENMGIFITDDKLFYQEDLNVIMEAMEEGGYEDVLIVTKEFSGRLPEVIGKIQQDNNGINILPVQIEDDNIIADLAAYVGVPLHSKNFGRPKEETIKEYVGFVDGVEGSMGVIIIKKELADEALKSKNDRISVLEEMHKKDKEDDLVKQRLASMTTGVVTLSVGGNTDIEKTERKLRFEDAILAAKNAMVYGYLPGGGTAMRYVLYNSDLTPEDSLYNTIFSTICEANAKQIEKNCGLKSLTFKPNEFEGLDAMNGEVVNMSEAGILDSYKAVEQSLLNAVSTSIELISSMSNTIIIKDIKED